MLRLFGLVLFLQKDWYYSTQTIRLSCLWYSWLVCFSHVLHEFVSCGTLNKFCLTNPTLTCPLDFTHDLKRTHEQLKTCYSVYTLEVQVHCLFLEWPFRKDHCFSIYNQQYQGTSLWSLTSSLRNFYRVILDLIKPWTKDSVINHPEFHWSRHQRRFFMFHIILVTPNDLTKGNSAGGGWWISVSRTQRLQGGPRIQL